MNCDSSLLEFLRYILDCTYISDLRTSPYNDKAKLLLKQLDLSKYPLLQVDDAFKYLNNVKK